MEAAGDIAHGSEQRQATGPILNGFEGHGREPDGAQATGELRQRRQVQVAEQQMVLAQPRQVRLYGLLDLDDHLRLCEQLVGRGQHAHAHVAIVLVGIAALLAGTVLDEHFVSATHQFDAGRWNESHPPLAGLQLTGNANTH